MSLPELMVLAIGLSMDAFAVSICKGLSLQKMEWKYSFLAGAYFGGFQAAMPLLGYILGVRFQEAITSIDHWVAFILLGIIGANMVKEALDKEEAKPDPSFDPKSMLLLAIATSIDALAIGVTLAFLKVRIVPAVSLIGVTTFCLSFLGVKTGYVFGSRYQAKAELAGGLILICIGTKILVEHTLFA